MAADDNESFENQYVLSGSSVPKVCLANMNLKDVLNYAFPKINDTSVLNYSYASSDVFDELVSATKNRCRSSRVRLSTPAVPRSSPVPHFDDTTTLNSSPVTHITDDAVPDFDDSIPMNLSPDARIRDGHVPSSSPVPRFDDSTTPILSPVARIRDGHVPNSSPSSFLDDSVLTNLSPVTRIPANVGGVTPSSIPISRSDDSAMPFVNQVTRNLFNANLNETIEDCGNFMEEGSSSPTLEECSSSPATEESSSSPATESSSSPAAEVHANIRLTNFKPWAASPGRVVRRSREQPPNDKTKKKIKDALYISEILNSTEWVSGPPSPVCKINGKHLRSNDRRSVRYRKGFTRPPPVKTNGRLAGASRRVVATSEKSDSSSGAESYATALSSFDSPRPMETKLDTSSGEGVDAGGVELSQKYPPNIIRRVPCSAGQPVTCKTTGTGINSAGRPVISKSAGTGTCSAGQPVICSIPRLETCSAHRPVTCKSSRLVDCKTGRPVICKTAGTITFSACQPVTCTAARSVTDCTAALPRGSRITLNIAKSSTDQSATAAELHPQPSTSSSSSETEMEFFDSQPFAKTSLASCSNKPAATASTKRAAASTKRLVDIIPIRRSRRETDDDEGAINVVGKNMLLPLNSSAADATELTTERDSKKKTNPSKKKKSVVYNYLKLKEIKKAENVNKRVCCHAVVSNFAPPFKSRGSDWVVNMNIIDESIHPDSLKCRLFIHDEDSLPRIEAVGDTVRLHRLKIVEYLDEIQGQSCPGFSCLVFHDDPALDPSSTSNNFTWSSADETRVVELKNWMKTVKLVSKPSLNTSLTAAQTSNTAQKQNRKTISQVQHGNHVNLLCQVIGCLHLNPVKSVLRIWDGTRLPQAASCQRYRDIQCDDDLVIISQDLSVDVLIFDEHCKDLAKIKANDYVEVVDLRVDRGRLVQTDFAFILNGGESNKRGIYKLDENSAEFSQLEQQLNTAIDEFYP